MKWKIAVLFALTLAPLAQGALITYRDDQGTLHVVSSEDEIPEQYRSRKKKLTTAGKREFEPGHTSVTKVGESYLVEVDFGAAGVHQMQIDLKQHFSTVKPAISQALKSAKVDKATIETTSGNIGHYPMVIIPKMVIAQIPVMNTKVVVAPDGIEGASGRLGRGFFSAYEMKIDDERSELFLTQKKK